MRCWINHDDSSNATSARRRECHSGALRPRSISRDSRVWTCESLALTTRGDNHDDSSAGIIATRGKSQSGWVTSGRSIVCNSRIRASEGRTCATGATGATRWVDYDNSSGVIIARGGSGDRSGVRSGVVTSDGCIGTSEVRLRVPKCKSSELVFYRLEERINSPSDVPGRSLRDSKGSDQGSRSTSNRNRSPINSKHRITRKHSTDTDRLEPNDNLRLDLDDRNPIRALVRRSSLGS